MNSMRLQEIRDRFIDEMPATWPEGYREVVIELVIEIEQARRLMTARTSGNCACGLCTEERRWLTNKAKE
ncbi:MAG: hypothetical protein WBQ34_09945 [Candidatus Acidiferrales bacterium]